MINAFAIENQSKVIEKYIVSGTPTNRIDKLIRLIQNRSKPQSKLTATLTSHDYTAFYFIQDSFKFILITQQPQKQSRIKKYLNTIAQIFYDQYDQKSFHKVLKYAVDEINTTQGSIADNTLQLSMSDEQQSDILLSNTTLQNKTKLKQKVQLRMNPKGRRPKIIIFMLILAILTLGLLYYFRHI